MSKRERQAAAEQILTELAEDDPALVQDICVRVIGKTGVAGAIVDELELRGAPAGTWLVDIIQTRQSLSDAYYQADELLERLQRALVQRHDRELPDVS